MDSVSTVLIGCLSCAQHHAGLRRLQFCSAESLVEQGDSLFKKKKKKNKFFIHLAVLGLAVGSSLQHTGSSVGDLSLWRVGLFALKHLGS